MSSAPDHIGVDFGAAIVRLRAGERLQRAGWHDPGVWIALHAPIPSVISKVTMTMPFIYQRTANGGLVPWVASHADLLARDWIVLVD